MKIYEQLPRKVDFNGDVFSFDADFKTVMFCFDVLNNENLEDSDKIKIVNSILFTPLTKIKTFNKDLKFKLELIKKIFEILVGKSNGGNEKKTVDFEQDEEMIFAGFMQCYRIDLRKEKLHWHKFISLFNGLSNDTRIMQIIDIRQRPIPKPTKYNAEERANLIRLKSLYALKLTEEEREKQFADSLNNLFDALASNAEKR